MSAQNNTKSTRAKLKQEVLFFFLTLIYSVSLAMLAGNILRLPNSFVYILIVSIVSILLVSLAFYNKNTSLATLGIILILGIIYFIFKMQNKDILSTYLKPINQHFTVLSRLMDEFIEEGYAFFYRNFTKTEAKSYHFLGTLVTIIASLLSYIFIQKAKLYWPLLLVIILAIPTALLAGSPWSLLWLIPMAIVAFLMILLGSGDVEAILNKKSGSKLLLASSIQLLIIISLAVIISLIGSNVLQYKQLYSPFWQGVLDDVSTRLPQSLQTDLSISPFSLSSDGLYPLVGRLGGTAAFKDNSIAEINGQIPSLLKVQSSDSYNGANWTRLLNNPNFRLDSPFNGTAEVTVFNPLAKDSFFQYLPERAVDQVYNTYEYTLRPLQSGSQLLFITGTPMEVESSRDEALLFYFNQAGTVYARTNFNTKHPYRVKSISPDPNMLSLSANLGINPIKLEVLDQATEKFLAAGSSLENRDNAYDNYLQIPDLETYREGGTVHTTAKSVTAGLTGEYEKVQALLKYFSTNPEFSYNLEVAFPPNNQDFVEHFLETKVGYCTYYATAMTMFLRLNGIPARYVEGYGLTPDNVVDMRRNETFVITSENAHAWTEVYLNGIGWVSVDATPGGVGNMYAESLPEDPELTTEPSTTPSETTSEAKPSTSSSETETTTSITETSTTTLDEPTPDSNILKTLVNLFWILLALLLIALLIFFYIKKRKDYLQNIHNPAWLKEKKPSTRERANFYWSEIQKLFRLENGYVAEAYDSEMEIAAQLAALSQLSQTEAAPSEAELNTVAVDWMLVGQVISEARYRKNEISEERLSVLSKAFDIKEEQTKESLGDAAYFRKRILLP